MKTVKSVKELYALIYDEVEKGLRNYVFDTVAEKMYSHIASDVYEDYSPVSYVRRYGISGAETAGGYDTTNNTGLLDYDNIVGNYRASGNTITLSVENITKGSEYFYIYDQKHRKQWRRSKNAGKFIAPVIETGSGYDIGLKNREQARPFIKNAANELRQRKAASLLLKTYLKGKGFKVK